MVEVAFSEHMGHGQPNVVCVIKPELDKGINIKDITHVRNTREVVFKGISKGDVVRDLI